MCTGEPTKCLTSKGRNPGTDVLKGIWWMFYRGYGGCFKGDIVDVLKGNPRQRFPFDQLQKEGTLEQKNTHRVHICGQVRRYRPWKRTLQSPRLYWPSLSTFCILQLAKRDWLFKSYLGLIRQSKHARATKQFSAVGTNISKGT